MQMLLMTMEAFLQEPAEPAQLPGPPGTSWDRQEKKKATPSVLAPEEEFSARDLRPCCLAHFPALGER